MFKCTVRVQHSESNWKAPKGKIQTLTFCLVWERQFYPEQHSALICSWLQLKQHFTSDISYRQRSHHLCATRDLYTQGRFSSLSPAKYSFCISSPSTFLHKQKSKAVTWPFITKLQFWIRLSPSPPEDSPPLLPLKNSRDVERRDWKQPSKERLGKPRI